MSSNGPLSLCLCLDLIWWTSDDDEHVARNVKTCGVNKLAHKGSNIQYVDSTTTTTNLTDGLSVQTNCNSDPMDSTTSSAGVREALEHHMLCIAALTPGMCLMCVYVRDSERGCVHAARFLDVFAVDVMLWGEKLGCRTGGLLMICSRRAYSTYSNGGWRESLSPSTWQSHLPRSPPGPFLCL